MARVNRRILLAWLWVALCAGLIWTLSGESFGAGSTWRFVAGVLRGLWPGIAEEDLRALHFAARKAAHVAEYALLGLLAFRALHLSRVEPFCSVALLALLLVLGVAATDELRQAFLPARTGSLGDVLLDLSGGAVGVLAIATLVRLRPASRLARDGP